MGEYVVDLQDLDRTQVSVVGGKGARLGELFGIEGISVPAGVCVTTRAFTRVLEHAPGIDSRLGELSRLRPDDREAIHALSAEIRSALESVAIPDEVNSEITGELARIGEGDAFAVRSSATTEDSSTASFAGQYDSFLGVTGAESIRRHVSLCWASLFTERAVTYRLRNAFDHRTVTMAVVVQRMVLPHAAGVLFTADPVASNRKVAVVEATRGLAEALVSGRVNADVYRVRDGVLAGRDVQDRPVLSDAQVTRLVDLGRRIEAHFGEPQDIEWCLSDNRFWFVQARPITTLFPIPETADGENHVFVSVGHQQMMTDPMKPLGLSFWQMTTPRPMREAGGRLFVDITAALGSSAGRAGLMHLLGRSDPLTGDAMQTLLDRGDFIPPVSDGDPAVPPAPETVTPSAADPGIVTELISRTQASIAALQEEIPAKSGPELLDFILTDLQELRRILFDPGSHGVIMAGMEATWWLNERLEAWLGEKNAADTLTQAVAHNVTSEMGLALLDVADVIRPNPEVVSLLRRVEDEGFLEELAGVPGGADARDAIMAYLDAYGMRCVGEIDITRPRWSERPSTLVPAILGNVDHFAPGEATRRLERGRRESARKEGELLERLRGLPDGERKAGETQAMIDRVRAFSGFREYPKYGMVSRYFVYKQALMAEAERLVEAGVLGAAEDIFYLRFEELHDVVRTRHADARLIQDRMEAFRGYRALRPPRVFTSDGEIIAGRYRRTGVPPGALVGLPVSTGVVEGRARVILDLGQAELEPGDILVTAFTDPSWAPLFIGAAGLVTEVGGLMTHGAVIAREYGLPAVVSVERATALIDDGQRIRVHGTDGYIEIVT